MCNILILEEYCSEITISLKTCEDTKGIGRAPLQSLPNNI